MKRPLKPEELRVWGVVAATVHPLQGRETPTVPKAGPGPHPDRSARHAQAAAVARRS
jgi:hypothetical protein